MEALEQLRFLTPAEVGQIAARWGTPVFVYDEATLRERARQALAFQAPFGLTVRYAMKANPNAQVLALFDQLGLAIDASSGYEATRALEAGISPRRILVTAQQMPRDLVSLVERGVLFNASSLHQLETFGGNFPGTEIGVRINPGVGSGHSHKTNVGGPASSFGIWHESVEEIKAVAAQHQLTITRLHTHIGSGTDPLVWTKVARLSLDQVRSFPSVTTMSLGGGFKVARMSYEKTTDLQEISQVVADALRVFAQETGRKLHLEIEPGTYLTANAGSLITTIDDLVATGSDGYKFLKLDSGMTDILRPTLYAAQHPLIVVNDRPSTPERYVVVGHCCESADLLTPHPDDSEVVATRPLQKAEIGDLLVIEGVGAYCASMSARHYNSFPRTPELLRRADGAVEEVTEP
ncbi:MAG: diaminopimelate decarboxylase [Chthoniobacterales bacterium]|nr:diaminopimelate decarboxylase [Chthoniobacterales bacterium]